MLNAENGRIKVNGDCLDYIRFGRGEKTLVMLPGLSDGLRTVAGLARPLALSYRAFAADLTVYMFSRAASGKKQTTREMAADLRAAIEGRMEVMQNHLLHTWATAGGTSGAYVAMGSGCPRRCSMAMDTWLSASKGTRPVSIS